MRCERVTLVILSGVLWLFVAPVWLDFENIGRRFGCEASQQLPADAASSCDDSSGSDKEGEEEEYNPLLLDPTQWKVNSLPDLSRESTLRPIPRTPGGFLLYRTKTTTPYLAWAKCDIGRNPRISGKLVRVNATRCGECDVRVPRPLIRQTEGTATSS